MEFFEDGKIEFYVDGETEFYENGGKIKSYTV